RPRSERLTAARQRAAQGAPGGGAPDRTSGAANGALADPVAREHAQSLSNGGGPLVRSGNGPGRAARRLGRSDPPQPRPRVAAANPGGFLTHLAAGAALGGFFLIFAVVFKGGLGVGDAKLGFLIGLALGWQTVSATMIALAGLLVVALWILATEGLKARKKA